MLYFRLHTGWQDSQEWIVFYFNLCLYVFLDVTYVLIVCKFEHFIFQEDAAVVLFIVILFLSVQWCWYWIFGVTCNVLIECDICSYVLILCKFEHFIFPEDAAVVLFIVILFLSVQWCWYWIFGVTCNVLIVVFYVFVFDDIHIA